MPALHTEAIVLRASDFGESDRIVHLLTPAAGRVSAMAKGARRSRRRFPGTLDLFHHLRVHLERPRRGGMHRLEAAALVHHHPRLREDPRRFALGCFVLELLGRLAPEGATRDDAARLFGFARESLAELDARSPDRQARVVLVLRALDAAGLRPELRRCVRCGREAVSSESVGFHVGEGGLLCGRCDPAEAATRVRLGTLRALERGLSLPAGARDRLRMAPHAVEEAEALLHRFQRFHLGVDLRSEAFLGSVLATD